MDPAANVRPGPSPSNAGFGVKPKPSQNSKVELGHRGPELKDNKIGMAPYVAPVDGGVKNYNPLRMVEK